MPKIRNAVIRNTFQDLEGIKHDDRTLLFSTRKDAELNHQITGTLLSRIIDDFTAHGTVHDKVVVIEALAVKLLEAVGKKEKLSDNKLHALARSMLFSICGRFKT